MASNTIPLPMPIKITGNPIAEWKRFHSQWNNYEIATDLTDKPSSKRAAVLLVCVGSDAYEVFETLDEMSSVSNTSMTERKLTK